MSLQEALGYAIEALHEAAVDGFGARRAPGGRSRYELTPREREVLDLVVKGRSNPQIAEALFMSTKTASVHVANIKGKLGVDSRVQIATMALRLGIAKAPEQEAAEPGAKP